MVRASRRNVVRLGHALIGAPQATGAAPRRNGVSVRFTRGSGKRATGFQRCASIETVGRIIPPAGVPRRGILRFTALALRPFSMRPASTSTRTLRERSHVTRALACLAASLAVTNIVFTAWPGEMRSPEPLPLPPPQEMIALEEIAQTTQVTPAYIPPPPLDDRLPLSEVPDDRVLEEVLRDVPLAPLPRFEGTATGESVAPMQPGPPGPPPAPSAGPPQAAPAPTPSSDRLVETPDQSPRVTRQAFPSYPDAARREGVRARVRVRVVVSSGGQPSDPQIVERVVLKGNGREEAVGSLPFGMDAAALEAARRHLFRPARDGGERVRAYAILTLSFDPPRGG